MTAFGFSNLSEVQYQFNKYRKIVQTIITVCAIISIIYFLYYGALCLDDAIYKYTGPIMEPLAKFLNPKATGYIIFKNTGVFFFSSMLPLFIIHYLLDKMQTIAYKMVELSELKKEEMLKKEAELDRLREFDLIKEYSICLSLDYKPKAKAIIAEATKEKINHVLFSKLNSRLNIEKTTFDKDAFIIISNKFLNYDETYTGILNTLSKLKRKIETVYPVTIIPNITTDAYTESASIEEIKKKHFEIKTITKENNAISTEMFRKKYKLNNSKYAGDPIGEFMSPDKSSTDYYELNMICKDLEKAL